MQRRSEGFTLIELMIVVAIIAIIAAIAIPSLLSARISGNEASAISSMRTLSTVSEQYRARFSTYPADLNTLATAVPTPYIDATLGAGSKSGYTFAYVGAGATWTCTALPTAAGSSGVRSFFVDESGVIRADATGAVPDVTSPPLD
ncbi:MAG: type IV pilin protein [Planctomycetota bacterium]